MTAVLFKICEALPTGRDWSRWQRFVGKGNFLSALMNATEKAMERLWPEDSRPTRQFHGTTEELWRWGWEVGIPNPDDMCIFGEHPGAVFDAPSYEMGSAFKALNINPMPVGWGGYNLFYMVEHSLTILPDYKGPRDEYKQNYCVNGCKYHRTGGSYHFAINKADGGTFTISIYTPRFSLTTTKVILALDLTSPMVQAKRKWSVQPTIDMMPAIRNASDIFLAYWLLTNPNPRNLRYYFAIEITNTETVHIINTILLETEYSYGKAPHWPGHIVPADSVDGQALIGTTLLTSIR